MEDRAQRLVFYERVGAELVRLRMDDHIGRLRALYRTTRLGLAPKEGGWTHEQVIELAKGLQVAPFEAVWPVRPYAATCGCATPKPFTFQSLPDRHVAKCDTCGEVWIVLDQSYGKPYVMNRSAKREPEG